MGNRLLAMLLMIPLSAAGASGIALHVCQSMGGVAVGDCDCEKRAHHGSHAEHGAHAHHASTQKLQPQPCCTVELSEPMALVATHEASPLRVEHADSCFVSPGHVLAPRSRLAVDSTLLRERAPPNIHGPPIFVRHCSFLN